ncbi:MAG: hypothetical protein ACYCUF_04890 [Acidimicrobiales bacterium]
MKARNLMASSLEARYAGRLLAGAGALGLVGTIALALPGTAFATSVSGSSAAGVALSQPNCPTPVSSSPGASASPNCPPCPTPVSSSPGASASAGTVCGISKFQEAKAKVEAALATRTSRLSSLSADVSASKTLTAQDRSVLASRLSAETAGISALAQKVPSDTTWKELDADAYSMVHDYRVFAVMSPQVDLTIGADAEAAIEWTLVGMEPGIQKAIADAANHGRDVKGAENAFIDYEINVADAESLSAGVAHLVLAQTPQGYPGNHQVFVSSDRQLTAARQHLGACRSDRETIVKDLFG